MTIISWILTVFFILAAFVYLPYITGFLALAVAILILPIKGWQDFLKRFIKSKIKSIVAVVLAILMLFSAPSAVEKKANDVDNVSSDISFDQLLDDSTEVVSTSDNAESTAEVSIGVVDETPKEEHIHSFTEATCTEPATCSCGEIQGTVLEHKWKSATCTEPKVCEACGTSEGAANGHAWDNATCTEPKSCTMCGVTEGEAVGHTWSNATCTSPKTCSSCGYSEGSANGHSWQNATCTSPKICSSCGYSEGYAVGHNFVSGNCSLCGANDPYYIASTLVWIPTKGGTKYHTHAGCSNMDGPIQVTEEEAKAQGFTPCKRCH